MSAGGSLGSSGGTLGWISGGRAGGGSTSGTVPQGRSALPARTVTVVA
ncbi:hypothetical protein PAI11_15200 [Patulibacter medicamentivorans]|uniref:Uncharacterized protein n=1 Tax=Patulibacter medicamentivorans TaxID=1097667 RepID=H0E3Z4_9ACTN|nr:hypothetical protein PAI11_15200 [Patulibacter medicamentivorans]